MSSPNDAQPPAEAPVPAAPSTQEIPVVAPAAAQQLPPHPRATTPAPVQTVQATGPVGFVPGLPGPLQHLPPAPTVAAPASEPAQTAAPAPDTTSTWPESLETGPVPLSEDPSPAPRTPGARERTVLLRLGLVAASLVLLELGLSLRFGGESFWSDIPLWSAFASICAVLGLTVSASLFPGGRRLGSASAWRTAAGGLVGLAVFWLLVVLPVVASDRGFLLTAALGCLGAALWIGPSGKG